MPIEKIGELIALIKRSVRRSRCRLFPWEVEDLAQEIHIRLITSLERHEEGEIRDVNRWAIGIAVNTCREYFKKRKRASTVSLELDTIEGHQVDPSCREDARRLLESVLPIDRQIIEQRFFYGMSYREIAGKLGMPQNTVKARASRAIGKLRQRVSRSLPCLLLVRLSETWRRRPAAVTSFATLGLSLPFLLIDHPGRASARDSLVDAQPDIALHVSATATASASPTTRAHAPRLGARQSAALDPRPSGRIDGAPAPRRTRSRPVARRVRPRVGAGGPSAWTGLVDPFSSTTWPSASSDLAKATPAIVALDELPASPEPESLPAAVVPDESLVAPRGIVLLVDAEQALRRGRLRRALRLLRRHERRHPGSSYVDDRLSLQVQALCGLGRHRAVTRMLRRHGGAHPSTPEQRGCVESLP